MTSVREQVKGIRTRPPVLKDSERVARLTALSPDALKTFGDFDTRAMINTALQALHNADDLRHLRSIVVRAPELLERAQQVLTSGAVDSFIVVAGYRRLLDQLTSDGGSLNLADIDHQVGVLLHADDHHHHHQRLGNDKIAVAATNHTHQIDVAESSLSGWRETAVKWGVVSSAVYTLGYFAIILFTVYAATSRVPGISSVPSPVRAGLVALLALPQNLSGPLIRSAVSRVAPEFVAGAVASNPTAAFATVTLVSFSSYYVLVRLTQLATDRAVTTARQLASNSYEAVFGSEFSDAVIEVQTPRAQYEELQRQVASEVARQMQAVDIEAMVETWAARLVQIRVDAARGELEKAVSEAKVGILETRMRQTDLIGKTTRLEMEALAKKTRRNFDTMVKEAYEAVDAMFSRLEAIGTDIETAETRLTLIETNTSLREVSSLARLGALERIAEMKSATDRGRNALALTSTASGGL